MRYAFLSLTALLLLCLAGCISPRRDSTSTNNGGSSDFTLAVSPSTTSVTAGATATFTVNVTANNGFTGTVTLSAAVPSTMQGTLSTTTISGGSGTATLSVTTSATAATGSSTVSVTGVEQGNGASQAANATITVTSATGASAQTSVQCITGEAGQPQSVLAASLSHDRKLYSKLRRHSISRNERFSNAFRDHANSSHTVRSPDQLCSFRHHSGAGWRNLHRCIQHSLCARARPITSEWKSMPRPIAIRCLLRLLAERNLRWAHTCHSQPARVSFRKPSGACLQALRKAS